VGVEVGERPCSRTISVFWGVSMKPVTTISTDEADCVGWEFEVGQEITAHKYAWALLGDGRRTESWLAWDAVLWAPVVVKLPRPDHLESERTFMGMQREAEVHRTVRHPAIQRLLEDCTEASPSHLVMEYIEGPALIDCVEDGPLQTIDVIRLGLQVGSILHFLHGQGLLYLDLKPHNVVVRHGHAVLLDLGFVRPIGWPTPDGVPRGSRPYMAPEQCRCEPVTESTDLFTLGAFLYEIASGEPAFESDEHCFEQLDRRAVPTRDHGVSLPEELDTIITALLEPNPSDRPTSVAEVLRALEALLPADAAPMWPAFASELLR
jgi:serine/threonine protein kinase